MPFHSSPDADPINASAFGIFHVTLLTSSLSMFVRPSRGIHDPTDRLVRVGMVAARSSLVKVRAVRGIVRPAREVLIVLEETPNSPMAVTFWSELPLPDDIGVGQKLRGSAV